MERVTVDPRRGSAPPDAHAIEEALAVVPGVGRVEVDLADRSRPGVLRIVLTRGGDAEAVAALARRILRLQFGVGLDTDLVEVVEDSDTRPATYLHLVETDPDGAILVGADIDALVAALDPGPGPRFHADVLASAVRHPAGAAVASDGRSRLPAPRVRPDVTTTGSLSVGVGRVAVGGLTMESDGLGTMARVMLVHDGRDYVGEAEGPSTAGALHRSVAAATLRALDGLLPPGIRLEVDAVSMAPIGDGTVSVVRVIWATAEGVEHLSGSSEVRDDPRESVIRATLDAVNRRLHVELVDR